MLCPVTSKNMNVTFLSLCTLERVQSPGFIACVKQVLEDDSNIIFLLFYII
jgi:hypothetical protein